MVVQSIALGWIAVSDIDKSRKFYKDILGLTEDTFSKEYGWAELTAPTGGFHLGLVKEGETPAGENTILTFTVEDLDATIAHLHNKGVQLVGTVFEAPGHVKLQTFTDPDGNTFQIVQKLD
jgi:predicted enzyme related to lactoylglutathione lyase